MLVPSGSSGLRRCCLATAASPWATGAASSKFHGGEKKRKKKKRWPTIGCYEVASVGELHGESFIVFTVHITNDCIKLGLTESMRSVIFFYFSF